MRQSLAPAARTRQNVPSMPGKRPNKVDVHRDIGNNGPMLTLAVVNQKGGVGKSTVATNLAAAAHLMRRRTLVIDMDRQGSALDWSAARAEGSDLWGLVVVKADRALTPPKFREIASGFDVVILDGPPRLGDLTRSAAVAADVVLVPVQPGPFDLWASKETLELLDAADTVRAELGRGPVARLFVVNRSQARTVLSREAPAALEAAGDVAGIVSQRQVFPTAAAIGESVLTIEPKGAAAREIRALYRSVVRAGVRSRQAVAS
jgi:chromosome partitioning protein